MLKRVIGLAGFERGLIEVKHLIIPEHLLKRDSVGDVKRVDMRGTNTFHRPVVVDMGDYRIRIQSEVAHRIRILKRKGLLQLSDWDPGRDNGREQGHVKVRESFWKDAIDYMVESYGVDRDVAEGLVERYGNGIDVRNEVIQHLGPDYIAIQMMMVEGMLDYEPM